MGPSNECRDDSRDGLATLATPFALGDRVADTATDQVLVTFQMNGNGPLVMPVTFVRHA